jgi:hypothetical protein
MQPSVPSRQTLLKELKLSLVPIVLPLVSGNVSAAANKVGFGLPGALTLSKIVGRLKTGGAGTNTTDTLVDVLVNGASVLRTRIDHVLRYVSSGAVYTDETDAAWSAPGTDQFSFCAASADRLYIGHNKPFMSLWYDAQAAAVTGAATFKYSRVGDSVPAGTFSGLKNGTLATAQSFGVDGLIMWDYPTDWAPIAINGITAYWMSIALATPWTTPPSCYELSIADNLLQIAAGSGSVEVTDIVTFAKPITITAGSTMQVDIKAVPETTPPVDLSITLGQLLA